MTVPSDIKEKLIALAKEAQEKAYAPYSHFPVGSAIYTEDGEIFTGCNVENLSYGLTNCAERTAVFKMISEVGKHAKIKYIAVTTKADIVCSPCGACRQVLQEFGPDAIVIYKGPTGYGEVSMKDLLPGAFTEFVAVAQDGSSKVIQSGR